MIIMGKEIPLSGKDIATGRGTFPNRKISCMDVVEEIKLANGLVAQIVDQSRLIAADTTRVAVAIVVPVPLKEEYFDSIEDFGLVKTAFGDPVLFSVTKERTFVDKENRESVFDEMVGDFKRDSLPYIERASFPSRFVLSKLSDIRKRPHRYRLRKIK